MKVFISQPMNGYSDEEILTKRDWIFQYIKDHFEKNDNQVELIDSFLHNCNYGPIWCLGESIKLMQDADLVVFSPGWRDARGCQVEHEVAARYHLNTIFL